MQGLSMRRPVLAMMLWMAVSAAWSAPAATPPTEVRVMVLATYHFGNPGQDAVNRRVDDVLQPQRQAQLLALTQGLAAFRPDKVLVERRPARADTLELPSYRAWLKGERRAQRNEVEQIGFRLAEARGLAVAYGIDAEDRFPFEALLRDHQFYTGALHFGDGDTQPGAELLGQWYLRNARICARIVQLARPGERIAVVYGAGHAYLLRQCVREQPGWRLVEPVPYLLGQLKD